MSVTLRWIGVLLLAGMVSGCGQQHAETQTATTPNVVPIAFNSIGAPTVEFSVPDMMCEEGCAAETRKILTGQEGVKDVKVDFPAKVVTVAVDDKMFDADKALFDLVDHGFKNSTLKSQQ